MKNTTNGNSGAGQGFETAWDFTILLHHYVEIKQQYGNYMATNIHDAHGKQQNNLHELDFWEKVTGFISMV